MDLINTLISVIQGDLLPGSSFAIDGIGIEVLSETKFVLDLPGETKTVCDLSRFLGNHYPLAFTEKQAMNKDIQEKLMSSLDRLFPLVESVLRDMEPGKWLEITHLMKFARSKNGSIVLRIVEGQGFAYFVKGPELPA